MKFGQLTEYNVRNVFQNFQKFSKLSVSVDQQYEML